MYTYFLQPLSYGKGNSPKASKATHPPPPPPPPPRGGAAKSFSGYRLLPLRSALYKTYIQIKYKSSHIYCREEIGVYAHYAYTPINYMKIEIILFYSVQIYRILYN